MGWRLQLSDAVVIGYSLFGTYLFRFGHSSPTVNGAGQYGVKLSYAALSILLGVLWYAALGIADTRGGAVLGVGAEEYRRVIGATGRLFAVVAIVSYLLRFDIARGYLIIALPAGTAMLLFERWLWRQWLVGVRRDGAWMDTVLGIGTAADVDALAGDLAREPAAGMRVIGTCLPDLVAVPAGLSAPEAARPSDGSSHDRSPVVPVLGCVGELRALVARHRVHTVAVTAGAGISQTLLRQIGWDLEGTGVQLIVTPALTNIAGTRIHVQPVAGLALLHVEEPRLPRGGQLAKSLTDRIGAFVLLSLLLPVFVAVAVAVRTTSAGPVYYRQERIGRRGEVFSVWKFRSMRADADGELAALLAKQNTDGTPLFKVTDDPRITRVGRFLRRTSLDELPQLINVLNGQMSLVGPRPQRAAEVELYDDLARRRLLTKPGMTGFWQVSGRSDLSWDEAVRLDTWYVENWSYLFDMILLGRTVWTVLGGRGAR